MKKDYLFSIISIVNTIFISAVIFGVFTLGAFVAPSLFRKINEISIAGGVMTSIFVNFFKFSFISTSIVIATEILRYFIFRKKIKNIIYFIGIVFLLITFAMVYYLNFDIAPKISDMLANSNNVNLWTKPEFVSMHILSEKLSKYLFVTGIIYIVLLPFSIKKIN